jgi:aldose sugar dehydrogenase
MQGFAAVDKGFNPQSELMDYDGKSNYSDPEFVWHIPVGVTALEFLNSDRLGKQYQNDMFVGDINNGNLYHFELDENRTGLYFEDQQLNDKIANNHNQLRSLIIGTFIGPTGGITDVETGPDGHLYVVSYGEGAIYRIIPKNQ